MSTFHILLLAGCSLKILKAETSNRLHILVNLHIGIHPPPPQKKKERKEEEIEASSHL